MVGIITSMSLFTSRREKWLWIWILAVVFAIYSTLGLAGTLAESLRNRGLLDAFFVFSALLVLVIILIQGLRPQPHGIGVVVVLSIAVAYFMVFVRMGIPIEERTHLIEYGVVAVLVHEALKERASQGRHVPFSALVALVVTILLGWLDEGIQAILPNRVYDIRDVGFNALAGLMAIVASVTLTWARRRWGR